MHHYSVEKDVKKVKRLISAALTPPAAAAAAESLSPDNKRRKRECEFAGLERWNGLLEWSTGLDYWSGRGACVM